MKKIILILMLTFITSQGQAAGFDFPKNKTEENLAQEVDDFIIDFHRHTGRLRLKRALKSTKSIIKYSKKCNIDPLLVCVIISLESSFKKNVIGKKRREIGLMQVHGRAARGFDLENIDGQISAGCAWIAQCKKNGLTLRGTLNIYATGKIRVSKRVQKMIDFRIRKYNRAKRKFRK